MQSSCLRLVLLMGCIALGLTCRCSIVDFSERFCRADYGVLVRAKDDGTVLGNDRVFEVRLMDVYRSNKPMFNVDRRNIYTSKDGSLCGIRLERNKYYVIAGTFREQKGYAKLQMYAGLCVALKEFKSRPLYSQFQAPVCPKCET